MHQRISSVWLRWSASTVNAYSVLYQPRLRTIDPGCGPWLLRIIVNPIGIAWARARHRASGARRGTRGWFTGLLPLLLLFNFHPNWQTHLGETACSAFLKNFNFYLSFCTVNWGPMSTEHFRNWKDSVQVNYTSYTFYVSYPIVGSCLPQ